MVQQALKAALAEEKLPDEEEEKEEEYYEENKDSKLPLDISEAGPNDEEEEEDKDLESYAHHSIPVKAISGKKSNLKSRNQVSISN